MINVPAVQKKNTNTVAGQFKLENWIISPL